MKKIVYFFLLIFLISFSLLSVSLFDTDKASAGGSYNYEIVEKSPDATINAGDTVVLWTKIKNTGATTWYGTGDHAIHLGTTDSKDRSSHFYTQNNWLSSNRVHWTNYGPYEHGDTADFGFIASAPSNLATGTYKECFYPVIENITWMNNQKICWNINVENDNPQLNYSAETVDNYDYLDLSLEPGETYDVQFKAKNTGGRDWVRHSTTPIHLATTHPNDRLSDIHHTSWISLNRPTVAEESVVRPGEIGTFNFTIQAPEYATGEQRYVEHFWLVAERDAWFQDPNPYAPVFSIVVHVNHEYINEYSEDNSSMIISKDNIISDGKDVAVVGIFLRDKQDQPIKYSTVNLNVAQFDRDTLEYQASTYNLETDFQGFASKEFRSTTNTDYGFAFKYKDYVEHPDWVYLTARVENPESGVFDPKNSKLTVSKNTAKPTGYDYVELKAEAKDTNNQPMQNQTIIIATSSCLLSDGDWHDCWSVDPVYVTTNESGIATHRVNQYTESVHTFSASLDNKYFLQTPIVEYIDEYQDNVEYDALVKVKIDGVTKTYYDSNPDVYKLIDVTKKHIYHNINTDGNSWGTYSMTKVQEEKYDSVEIIFDPHTSLIHDRPHGFDMNDVRESKTEINRIVILFQEDDHALMYYGPHNGYDTPDFENESEYNRRWSFIYGGYIPNSQIWDATNQL